MPTKPDSKPKYIIGEKILCFHGPLFKSGKKVKVLRKAELQKQSYPLSINTKKEKDDHTSQASTPSDVKEVKTECKDESDKSKSSTKATNNKKRKLRGPDIAQENESLLKKAVLHLRITPNLKAWLVDDWDLVTRQSRLHELPVRKTVSAFLKEFLDYSFSKQECKSEPSTSPNTAVNTALYHDLRTECVAGVQLYFDTVLGSHLLYKFERLQYGEIYKQNPEKKLSDIYGPIHLLRLFVKMRELVGMMKVDTTSLDVLGKYLNEILEFLNEREEEYITLKNYTIATAEYQRRAMC